LSIELTSTSRSWAKLRLGFDGWGLSGDLLYTGGGQYSAHLLTALSLIESDVSIVVYGSPGEPRPAWLPGVIEWSPVESGAPAKVAALYTRLFVLPRLLRRDAIDVFHMPTLHVRPSLPPVTLSRVPPVVTIHDLIPRNYYGSSLPLKQRLFYSWNLRRAQSAAAIITVSKASRSEIEETLGLPAGRVRVAYNGIDFSLQDSHESLSRLGVSRPFILYAGSYEPRKNLLGAVEAFAALGPEGSVQLVAIVERESGFAEKSRARIAELALADRVHLVHSLTDSEIKSLYSRAEAFLFPSFAEGFGFPPLQAAACGIPMVVSDLPALRETLGDAAVFVDPRDSGAIAAALREILSDPAKRRRLAEAGPPVASRFSWEESARIHLEVFREVAHRQVNGSSTSAGKAEE
jgi:glycosyltransferase involved in cell wall biosynthesis